MEILYKDKNLVAVYKPAGIPAQSDNGGDKDAMTITGEMLKACGESDALWLIHRLDRVVGGIMVFARNKASAAKLSELAAERGMKKEYLAVVDGVCNGGLYRDYIYKDSLLGKAFVTDRKRSGVKEAELECKPVAEYSGERGPKTLMQVELRTGRFHQIRVQLASRRTPITSDGKYGSRDSGAKMPALFAFRLSFVLFGKKYSFFRLPMAEYPWSLFDLSNITE